MTLLLVGAVLMFGFQLASAFNLAFFELPGYVQTMHALGIVLMAGAVWLLTLPALDRARVRYGHALSEQDLADRVTRVFRASLLALVIGVHLGVHSAVRLLTGSGPLAAFLVLASLAGCLRWMLRQTADLGTAPEPPMDESTENRIRRLEKDLAWHHEHAADHGCPWDHATPAS